MNAPASPAASPFASAWRAQVGAEIKNRLRSPASLVAFLVILIGSYWAIPPAEGNVAALSWRLPDGRLQAPFSTSSYVGIALSVLVLIFFLLAAFYLVAGAVRRDRERGIGLILAASPISKSSYLGAKFVAHVAYLGLLSLLAVPVGLFHFWRFGAGAFEPIPFFGPALLAVLPAAAFVSAAALLFDVTPGLRSKGGLVLWFLVAMPVLSAIPMTLAKGDLGSERIDRLPIFDPLGLATDPYLLQATLPEGARDVSTGYVIHQSPLERVAWAGIVIPAKVLWARLGNLLWALVPLLAAVGIFDRFDPARRSGKAPRRPPAPVDAAPATPAAPPRALSSLSPVRVRTSFLGAVVAEARLTWESAHGAKWLLLPTVVAAAFLPGAAMHYASALFLLLLVPVLSEVGCREELAGAGPLVFSQPAVPGSMVLWKFVAIALLLVTLSLPLTIRGFVAGSVQAVAVPLGMLFVAAFAVGAASLSRGGKLFSGVYLLLWYLGLNKLAGADFCAVLAPEASWMPRFGFTLAGALWLAGAMAWERRRARA